MLGDKSNAGSMHISKYVDEDKKETSHPAHPSCEKLWHVFYPHMESPEGIGQMPTDKCDDHFRPQGRTRAQSLTLVPDSLKEIKTKIVMVSQSKHIYST